MSKRLSEEIADSLRTMEPELNEISRARMERELLSAVRAGRRSAWFTPSRAFLMGVSATLAAAALFLWLRTDSMSFGNGGNGLAFQFESRRQGNVVEQGVLREGAAIRTGENETARIRVRDSEFDVGAHSVVQFAEVSESHLRVALREGFLNVAFHPRHRGQEHLSIETPNTRVDVVGTVFSVTLERDGATRVRVQEGVVRVTEAGHASALVHAGNETRVGGGADEPREAQGSAAADPVSAQQATADPVAPNEASEPAQTTSARAGAPRTAPPSAPDFSARLASIERMIEAGQTADARAQLEALTHTAAPSSIRANAWNQLGDIDQGARRYADAATEYEHAASLGATDAFWSLARVRDRYLHDPEGARPAYENYLRVAPRGAEAALARTRLCELGVREHCSSLSGNAPPGNVAP